MSETVDVASPPSPLAYGVAHLLIGLLVAAVTKLVFKQKANVAIVAGVIAVGLHYSFDAPVARRLSDLLGSGPHDEGSARGPLPHSAGLLQVE